MPSIVMRAGLLRGCDAPTSTQIILSSNLTAVSRLISRTSTAPIHVTCPLPCWPNVKLGSCDSCDGSIWRKSLTEGMQKKPGFVSRGACRSRRCAVVTLLRSFVGVCPFALLLSLACVVAPRCCRPVPSTPLFSVWNACRLPSTQRSAGTSSPASPSSGSIKRLGFRAAIWLRAAPWDALLCHSCCGCRARCAPLARRGIRTIVDGLGTLRNTMHRSG